MQTYLFGRAKSPRLAALRLGLVILPLSLMLSCAAPAADEPLDVQVRWGLGESTTLPDSVTGIQVVTCIDDGTTETCDSTSCSLAALTLTGPNPVLNCRPAEGTEMFGSDPVLVRRNLPRGQPIRYLLRGSDDSNRVTFVGQAGPFVLGQGERRQVSIQMYPVDMPTIVPGASVRRVLHTSTLLPDGRVLVAGGFTGFEPTSCPATLSLGAEANCFDLTATNRAAAYDVSTGTLTDLGASMLAARGGHTATRLPDGRVLLAGGASRAVLAMIPQGAGAVSGYRMEMFPLEDDGSAGAHDHYEIFDAFLNGDPVDPERDGDPARGGFFGVAGSSSPGALNQPRFLHAAAAVQNRPNTVLLAGGLGGNTTARTYEVFDYARAGGFGVYQGGGNLSVQRTMPSAIAVGDDQVWIFGGATADEERDLADVWQVGETDNGSVLPASDLNEFPQSMIGGTQDRPEFALTRPSVAAIDDGQRALVVGWYGPRCEIEADTPLFVAAEPTEVCNSPPSGATRSFTVEASTGLASPTTARLHAFGAVAELTPFAAVLPNQDPEFVPVYGSAVTGGVANRLFGAQVAIDVFLGTVDGSGAAQQRGGTTTLLSQRLFHTSTGVPGYGIITLGGFVFSSASLDRVVFEDDVEALFLGI
ncbi:MAG: hypothetical protein AB8I08_04575 [Sandaracinaceae bacterium]